MLDLGSATGRLLLDTQGFSSGFTSALQSVRTMQSASATMGDKFTAVGKAMTAVGGNLTKSVTLPIVAMGTAAVKTASDFESSMSQVQATLGIATDAMSELNGQSVNTMDALSDLAKELGAKTKFSATEAAKAINNMAMAGYSTQEIYDSLPQVLSLASAGMLDLDYATQLVANGLNVMGMSTSSAQELADKLAVTASNAYGSVSDFGEALLKAGAQASLANVSLTDTMTALGILGDNGISASEGGTALRNVLKNLYTPTNDAAKALKELGVETSNSDGSLRDIQDVLKDLGSALDGLTEEQRINFMSKIFDTRTIAAANALIDNSSDRWDELSSAIDNAGGAAEKMASTQLDNLKGQLTILKSSIEGAGIAFGEMLLPIVKQLAVAFQNLMNWINNLDEGQKNTVVKILAIVAAIGPLLIIFGKLSTAIGAIIGLFSGTGGLAAAFSLFTGPIGLVIAAVAALAAAWATDFMGIREVTAEALGIIQSIIQTFVSYFKTAWETNFLGIQDITSIVWQTIQTVFSTSLQVILSVLKIFDSALKGDWKSTLNSLKELGSQIWSGIKAVFKAALNSLKALIIAVGIPLYNAAKTAWGKIKEGAIAAWTTVTSWFLGVIEGPVNIVKGIATDLYNAGKGIITSFLNGLKASWGSIAAWFTEKAGWLSSVWKGLGGTGGGGPGGSYASGIDYITHDRVVQVHEGEAILTKEENKERRNPNRNSGGDTYNFYSPKALNPTTAAREMKKAKQELALGVS